LRLPLVLTEWEGNAMNGERWKKLRWYVKCMLFVLQLYVICMVNVVQIHTTTIPLSQIPIGKVVSINGLNFIKIAENKYQAVCGQMTCANVEHCAVCSLNEGNACNECEDGYHLEDGVCEEGVPTPSTPTTLQNFTTAHCTVASPGIVAIVANNGSGSYVIRKLADGNCYVNMGVNKRWYSSNTATGDCTPSNSSFAACNTCYSINNSADWFLPSYTQYNSLVAAVGSGGQLYAALSLSADTGFWSSSEYTSSALAAWYLYVESSFAYIYDDDNYKMSARGVLCRRN
jgi:hypothetical protein